jgi:hypothetical protein
MSRAVPKIRSFQPESNLPGRSPRVATAEARFTIAFARTYLDALAARSPEGMLACARQVPVNGFGIADLVVLRRDREIPGPDSLAHELSRESFPIRVLAFEVKLVDWRRGIAQAHRYRYFADVAILLLPRSRCELALPYLGTFRKIQVGLWSYDPSANSIVAHYTPRVRTPLAPKYRADVARQILGASKFGPFTKMPDPPTKRRQVLAV